MCDVVYEKSASHLTRLTKITHHSTHEEEKLSSPWEFIGIETYELFQIRSQSDLFVNDTIYKSKAVGEPPFMLGMSAFFALSDAIAACGPNFANLQAPATAEEVLSAIARSRDV